MSAKNEGIVLPFYNTKGFLNKEALYEEYVEWVRGRFYAILCPGGDTSAWLVSDIFKWTGGAWGGTTYRGGGFIVEPRSAGVPTGEQFGFVIPYQNLSDEISYLYQGGIGSTSYMMANGTTVTWTYSSGCLHIFYFPRAAQHTQRITATGVNDPAPPQFQVNSIVTNLAGTKVGKITVKHSDTDWEVQMTKGAGFLSETIYLQSDTSRTFTWASEVWRDFPNIGFTDYNHLRLGPSGASQNWVTTTVSPYTHIANFFPLRDTIGYTFPSFRGIYLRGSHNTSLTTEFIASMAIILNADKPFVAAYSNHFYLRTGGSGTTFSRGPNYPHGLIMGKLFINEDVTITDYRDGSFSFQMSGDPVSISPYFWASYTQGQYHTFGGGGNLIDLTLGNIHTNFTEHNYKINGKWLEDVLGVYSTNEIKGWFDPDIVRIQGITHRDDLSIISRNDYDCIKIHRQLVFPWSRNIAPLYNDPSYLPPEHLLV
jgi:hypothetical protein